MPPPGKSIYLRGGKSAPTYDPGHMDSFSSHAGSSFLSRGSKVLNADETIQGSSSTRHEDSAGQQWNPRNSMAYNSAKGLLNPVGENNCFLNCAVQVFWHLDVFRRNFRLLSGHACLGSTCVFCALKAVFTQYQFSERPALPADSLRRALALTFAGQQRFQMGFMDDASECFENILLHIHHHVAPDQPDDNCQAPHCLPHQKFSMKIKEQVLCQCLSKSGELSFDQMVHYIATTSLMAQVQRSRAERIRGRSRSFGQLLKDAKSDGETRKCSSNCGRLAAIHRSLTNMPEVISIGFIWDSERPSFEHIRGVVNAVSTELRPHDLFDLVHGSHRGHPETFQLVGIICYYSHHYSTFFFHSKMKTWVLFDDARILEIGPNWRSVADRCCQGHYQPLLLLYTKTSTCPIDVTSAPPTTFVHKKTENSWQYRRNHEYVQTYCPPSHETNYQELIRNPHNEHPSFLNSGLDHSFKLSESRSTLVDSVSNDSTSDGTVDETWKHQNGYDRLDHTPTDSARQSSYLYAITGPKSFYDNETFSSYVAACDNASTDRMRKDLSRDAVGKRENIVPHNVQLKSGSTQQCTNSVGVNDCGRTGNNGIYNSLPHTSRVHTSEPSNQSCYSQRSRSGHTGDGWDYRPGSAPCNRPPPMVSLSTGDFHWGNSLAISNNGKPGSHGVGRVVEEADGVTESQYISATKVQNVLMSQGVKTRRCHVQSGDRKASDVQYTALRCTSGKNAVPRSKIAGCHNNMQILSDSMENISIGSHKDSGYRSGESNDDRSSPNSVLSSPSIESGEFLPARNAHLIAQNFMKSEREDYVDIPGITMSLDNLSSRSSGQRNVVCRRQRKTPTMSTIDEIDSYASKDRFSASSATSMVPGGDERLGAVDQWTTHPYSKDINSRRKDNVGSTVNPPRKLLHSEVL